LQRSVIDGRRDCEEEERKVTDISVIIRSATASDATKVSGLLEQLSYPTPTEEVVKRLGTLDEFHDAVALVAEVEGEVVGLITAHVFPSIVMSSPVVWLTALVTADGHRQLGVGKQLTSAIEQWAGGRGATRISLTSATHRSEAHAFYEHLGYERTGVRLAKPLG